MRVFRRAPAEWRRGLDGGLAVDARMQVQGAPAGVYAAGDACCAAAWEQPHWHQMRLWSQARAGGGFAGRCMADAEDASLDATFELFTHCTRFLGLPVVLLGRFNGQGLLASEETTMYSRVDAEAFVRVLLVRGRLRGAVLIGDEACALAETFEQLILDELDVGSLGPHILDPDVDIEDYFD
jgi:hypothetical protein